MPTLSFHAIIHRKVGSEKVYDIASHRILSHLLWGAEGDLKTGKATGPFPPPSLRKKKNNKIEGSRKAHAVGV